MDIDLYYALWITLVGMSLVFASILLLWAVMALIMRLLPVAKAAEQVQRQVADDAGPSLEANRKRQAALAAVVVALAQQADSTQPHEFPLPPPAMVSAWQAVARSRTLSIRGSRK